MLGGKGLTWQMPNEDKSLYLTFDDGPSPETTPLILEILDSYNAKATFFCVGENVDKHPGSFRMYIEAGHKVGNHSYSHPKGWETDTDNYLANVQKCSEVVKSTLFRPPYGKMTRSQQKALRENYDIIMWTVLSRDYDSAVDAKTCLAKTWKYTRPGAIVLFHDSTKTIEKLKYVLPEYLDRAVKSGYSFSTI